MPTRASWIVIGTVCAGSIAVAALYWFLVPGSEDAGPPIASQPSTTAGKNPPQASPNWVSIGGVMRASTDVTPIASNASKEQAIPDRVLHGFSPPVQPEANPQTKQVHAALKERVNSAAYSSFIEASQFDAEAYEKDPSVEWHWLYRVGSTCSCLTLGGVYQ